VRLRELAALYSSICNALRRRISSEPDVWDSSIAPRDLTTRPALGYGTPEFPVPLDTGTPRTFEMVLLSLSVLIGFAETPLFEAVANAPTCGSPPIVEGLTGTSSVSSSAVTVLLLSRGSIMAP